MKTALIIIDLQNDFCPGGNLAIAEGDKLVPIANRLQDYFDLVVATQDWHPKDHTSFASNHAGMKVGDVVDVNGLAQILWPSHCVQNSKGAEFYPGLNTQKIQKIFHKGIDKNLDSYSGFFDNAHLRSTGLGEYLKEQGVEEIYLMGLATDYCVKFSSLDAVRQGFRVNIIVDACRGVELLPGDIEKSLANMQKAGVNLIHIEDLSSHLINSSGS